MKKIFALCVLIMLAIATRAQEVINYDFEITRPLSALSLNDDENGIRTLKKGCTWTLVVKDFDTAGNIVTLDIQNPEGETAIHKEWDNARVVNVTLDDGSEAYVVGHGLYTYVTIFELKGADGQKKWYASLYTRKLK